MEIKELNRIEYLGKRFTLEYTTAGYYDIEVGNDTFLFAYKQFEQLTQKTFSSEFFSEWLDDPVAYGVFEGDDLLGFVEGTLEKWNNRYRITNIGVFNEQKRRDGIGTVLMNQMLRVARHSEARMVVLETQSCNEKAISFYKKHGFSFIGFDLYAYTDADPQRHEVRMEMGMKL